MNTYKCDICGKTFKRKSGLMGHMLYVHNIQSGKVKLERVVPALMEEVRGGFQRLDLGIKSLGEGVERVLENLTQTQSLSEVYKRLDRLNMSVQRGFEELKDYINIVGKMLSDNMITYSQNPQIREMHTEIRDLRVKIEGVNGVVKDLNERVNWLINTLVKLQEKVKKEEEKKEKEKDEEIKWLGDYIFNNGRFFRKKVMVDVIKDDVQRFLNALKKVGIEKRRGRNYYNEEIGEFVWIFELDIEDLKRRGVLKDTP